VIKVAPTLTLGIKHGLGPIQMDAVSAYIALIHGSASIHINPYRFISVHINPYQFLDQRESISRFMFLAAQVNGNCSDEDGFCFKAKFNHGMMQSHYESS